MNEAIKDRLKQAMGQGHWEIEVHTAGGNASGTLVSFNDDCVCMETKAGEYGPASETVIDGAAVIGVTVYKE